MRYAISLTSIPPRFDRLEPVLQSLLAQSPAPECVLLTLPRQYRRFPGTTCAPDTPSGVEILWSDEDHGPATKALPAAEALSKTGLRQIYCDDDWIYGPGWADALLSKHCDNAIAGSVWGVERIGRTGNGQDIAQGFSGVLVNPEWLIGAELNPPPFARPVDDIWLSGHLSRQGIEIDVASQARTCILPAYDDAYALQKSASRDTANRATAKALNARYGIWPEI